MRILITGGTGFIGSSLIKKLANSKHQILALTRQKKEKYKNIFFYKCDLNKKNGVLTIGCVWGIPFKNLNV